MGRLMRVPIELMHNACTRVSLPASALYARLRRAMRQGYRIWPRSLFGLMLRSIAARYAHERRNNLDRAAMRLEAWGRGTYRKSAVVDLRT